MSRGSLTNAERPGTMVKRYSLNLTLYHGTSEIAWKQIQQKGLSSPFLTDSLVSAREYAQSHRDVRRRESPPAILAIRVPEIAYQPNGRPAPPYYLDDWHRDSEMQGNGYEYDAEIPCSQITLISA